MPDVAGDDGQPVNDGDGGDHAVFENFVLSADHEARPCAHDAGVARQQVRGAGQSVIVKRTLRRRCPPVYAATGAPEEPGHDGANRVEHDDGWLGRGHDDGSLTMWTAPARPMGTSPGHDVGGY